MKKLIITSILVVIAGISFFVSDYFKENDPEGEITIILVDEIGDTIVANTYFLEFEKEDSLFDMLDENFEIGCADSNFHLSDECTKLPLGSRVILKIDTIETDWINTFIAIYINEEYSNYGIDDIALKDGDIIRFEYTLVEERGGN